MAYKRGRQLLNTPRVYTVNSLGISNIYSWGNVFVQTRLSGWGTSLPCAMTAEMWLRTRRQQLCNCAASALLSTWRGWDVLKMRILWLFNTVNHLKSVAARLAIVSCYFNYVHSLKLVFRNWIVLSNCSVRHQNWTSVCGHAVIH